MFTLLFQGDALVPHLYCRFWEGLFLQLFSAKILSKFQENYIDTNNVTLVHDLRYCCY